MLLVAGKMGTQRDFFRGKQYTVLHGKRHAGDLQSGDRVSVVGMAYDIYERANTKQCAWSRQFRSDFPTKQIGSGTRMVGGMVFAGRPVD